MIRMKVRASVKKISPDDKIVRRKGRIYVINKLKPQTQAEARLMARISGVTIPNNKQLWVCSNLYSWNWPKI